MLNKGLCLESLLPVCPKAITIHRAVSVKKFLTNPTFGGFKEESGV